MKRLFLLALLPFSTLAATNDVRVQQQTSQGSFVDRIFPGDSTIGTTTASYRSAIGLGTEDTVTFAAGTLGTGDLTISTTGKGVLLHGNGSLTAASGLTTLAAGAANLNLSTGTTDGTDNKQTALLGGGGESNSRGGYIVVYGNEHALTGAVQIVAGNVSGGNVELYANNAQMALFAKTGAISLTANGTNQNITLTPSGTGKIVEQFASTKITIDEDTAGTDQLGMWYLPTATAISNANYILSGNGTTNQVNAGTTLNLQTGGSSRVSLTASSLTVNPIAHFQNSLKRVTSQFDKTNDTLANVTGLSVSLEASKSYRFRAVLFTTSDVAAGVKFSVATTGTATNIIYEAVVTAGAAVVAQTRATSYGSAVGGVTAVTAATCIIEGSVSQNGAGNLNVQFAQNATNAAASSILIGSYLEVFGF